MSLTDKKVAVLGLGYVGLPLAALCAKRGYRVTGFDSNTAVVASLRERKCHIRDDTVERLLGEAFDSSNLALAAEASAIAACEIYLVCVPTPAGEVAPITLGMFSDVQNRSPGLTRSGQCAR